MCSNFDDDDDDDSFQILEIVPIQFIYLNFFPPIFFITFVCNKDHHHIYIKKKRFSYLCACFIYITARLYNIISLLCRTVSRQTFVHFRTDHHCIMQVFAAQIYMSVHFFSFNIIYYIIHICSYSCWLYIFYTELPYIKESVLLKRHVYNYLFCVWNFLENFLFCLRQF